MKYFIVEGILKNIHLMNDDIMKEHIAYTKKAMNNGIILMSGLKCDNSGGTFIIKANSTEELNDYLSNEPFKLYGIQDYTIIEFTPHYFNQSPNEWLNKH